MITPCGNHIILLLQTKKKPFRSVFLHVKSRVRYFSSITVTINSRTRQYCFIMT